MVILDTVGVVVVIGDERRPLKYTGAGAAAETVGVETLAHRLQHTVCNLLSTSGTHRQGILRRNRKNIRCMKRQRRTFKCKRMWPSLLTKNTQNKTVNLLKLLKVKIMKVNIIKERQISMCLCVSSPHSSPHTEVSRPCHRTACPAGGGGSSCNRSSWSGRVYPWLSQPAGCEREPRHTSHKPLQRGGRRRVYKSKIWL